METLTLKTRLSVLWIFMAVAMSAHGVLSFMEREVVEQMWEMEMGPGMMLFMAILWWVPLVMAVLSVTLRDSANRWANMILGIVFTVLSIGHLTEHLAHPAAHQLLIVASTIVVAALIFWFALKWPKQKAQI
jgi:heme A synthase